MDKATRQKIDAFLIAQGLTPPKSDYLAGALYADRFHADAAAKNPEVQQLIASGGTGTVNKVIGDTDVRVENGKITHYSTGGIWKPIMAAALVAGTAGAASAFAPVGAGATGAAGGGTAALPATTVSALGAMPAATSSVLPALGATTAATTAATVPASAGLLGTLGRYGQTASDLGELASAGAQGQAEGRRADSTADMYAASQNNRALVDAATFNRDLPMTRAAQTARGDLMSSPTMQDSQITGSGRNLNISGGVRPSSFGASTTQAGDELKRQALLKLMDPEADKLTPQLTTPRKAGVGENALGITGTALGVLGAYGKYRGGR